MSCPSIRQRVLGVLGDRGCTSILVDGVGMRLGVETGADEGEQRQLLHFLLVGCKIRNSNEKIIWQQWQLIFMERSSKQT